MIPVAGPRTRRAGEWGKGGRLRSPRTNRTYLPPWQLTTTPLARARRSRRRRASKLCLAATDKDASSSKIDEDETDAAESFELPGADLSNEELSIEVVPKQDDEFTCSVCFLVHHRSARIADAPPVCRDCA